MFQSLTLKEDDPRVMAAIAAEQRLFAAYGIQATTHYLPLPAYGLRLRISEIGAGEPVVMVPGNTGEVFPLAPLLARLPGRRIIAVNRPGSGASDGMDYNQVDFRAFTVETLVAVLDAFALDRAPIIAHSIGGHISLWLALDRPERVSALALLGVPGNILRTRPPLALRLLAVPLLNRLLIRLITPIAPAQALRPLTFMGHPPQMVASLPPALAECYFHFQRLPYARLTSFSMMEQSNRFWGSKPDIRITADELRRVRQPVLFLWGSNDPFGSLATGREIAAHIAGANFQPLEGAGHLPWLDQPAACARQIEAFFG